MGLFDRGRRPAEMDAALTFLTVDEARHLRSLVRAAFAGRGVEVIVHPGHVASDAGDEYGLWNLAAACHDASRGRRAWSELVAGHVDRLLARAGQDPFEDLTEQDAARSTYARLFQADDDLHRDLALGPRRVFAPGLVEMAALDLPESVVPYSAAVVERFGADRLRTWGLENLRREPVEHLEAVEAGGGSFHVLAGASVHTASRALLMPSLAGGLTGYEAGHAGWLLSVPTRHEVLWHVLRDTTAVPALQGMVGLTLRCHENAAGQLSPHVYWWSGDGYEQLTHVDDDGGVAVHVGEAFAAVLERLSRLP